MGSVTEGSPAGFMIQLSGMASGTVTANWQTVPGTATAGDDFTAASGSVQLSEMMNFETIYIATLTDSVYDPDETFSVEITSVIGDATIGTPSSAQVTIEDSEPPGGGGGGEPTGISVASPGTLNEGDQFNLHVTLSPPGIYMVSGTVDWGDSPGMGSETFSGYTLSDGQIWLPHQYYDDGPTPGNDTSSDIETITVTVAGLVGTTNATIQNVAPAGSDFGLQDISSSSLAAARLNGEVLDVMPAGDSLEATIDWGDESTPQVINGSSMLNLSVEHIYPVPWKSYTVAVTVRDDDLGIYSWTGAVFVDPPDPTGDLQIRYPGLAAISDDDELDPGGFPLVENDTQLVTLHLSPAMNSFPDAKYALEYGAGSITLWKDEALTDPVVSGAYDFDANAATTIYVDATTLGGSTIVELYWRNVEVTKTKFIDEVRLTPADVDLQIYHAPIIDTVNPAVPEEEELLIGAGTWVNLDNDDADEEFDLTDSDGVPFSDDEFAKLRVRVTPPQMAGYLAIIGAPALRLWTTSDKTPGTEYVGLGNLLTPSAANWASDGTYKYVDLWVEGISPSTQAADQHLDALYQFPTYDVDTVAVTVLGVESIEWIGINNSLNHDNLLDGLDPNWQVASTTNLRVFPDALWETTQVGSVRDKVDVRVTLNVLPPVPVEVYLREFDVDDPSAFQDAVDDETTADDNRAPSHSGFQAGSHSVGPGLARLSFGTTDLHQTTQFGVSLHAGDNYRIAANADLSFLEQLENDDRNFTVNDDKQRIVDPNITSPTPPTPAAAQEVREPAHYTSPTLTVWRFLNTELDTMPALGPTQNWISGTITGIVGTATALTRVNVADIVSPNWWQTSLGDDSDDLDNGPTTPGRFENGTLNVGPAPGGVVIAPVIGNGDFFVEVATAAAPANIAGLVFTAEDDDYWSTPETATGTVTQITPVAGGFELTLDVPVGTVPWGEMDGGRIAVGGGAWVDIIGENATTSTVTVAALSIPFSIHDDDNDALLPYNTPGLHPLYLNAFRDAYIEPVLLTANDGVLSDALVNIYSGNTVLYAESEYDDDRMPRFWVAYNMWVFQLDEDRDYDADSELHATDAGIGRTSGNRKFSAVAVESSREVFLAFPVTMTSLGVGSDVHLVWYVLGHEVGHQFGLNDRGSGDGLMGPLGSGIEFIADDLALIRGDDKSPGTR